jgi:ABC-2 type transport system permease protein
MKAVIALALKDLTLLRRDAFGMFWIAAFPLLFALFFGAVISSFSIGEGRTLSLAVIDEEQSTGSKEFVDRLKNIASLRVESISIDDAREAVRKGKLAAYLIIESGFGDGGMRFGGPGKKLELGIDPARRADGAMLRGLLTQAAFADMQELFSDPAKGQAMARKALKDLENAKDIDPIRKATFALVIDGLDEFLRTMPKGEKKAGMSLIDLREKAVTREIERPRSAFEVTFPQSILWGLMGCVASFSISIVLERNQGTFLRLRTSPLSWMQVLAGKALGCFLTSVFVAVLLLTFASLVLGVRLGDPLLLALAITSTAWCFTGLTMFFATLGRTEAGVSGAGWGIMMPMSMIGGGMVPLLAMPRWMQILSNFSPVKWGILILEGAVWRGFSLSDMLMPCGILLSVGIVGFALGVLRLRTE